MAYDLTDLDLSDLLAPEPLPVTFPKLVHERDLAVLLGMTRQSVAEQVRSGVLDRAGRAQFELVSSVNRYCDHLRRHAGRVGRPAESSDALKAERLRLTKAQAEAQEAKNRLASGELVEAAAVAREWQTILRDVRAAILAVPSRYGAAMPHLSASDVAALDREIRAALEGLADGNA